MTVVIQCTSDPTYCLKGQQMFCLKAGKGDFSLTLHDFKKIFQCPCCESQASEVIECRFNNCAWRCIWAAQKQPVGVRQGVVGPVQTIPQDAASSVWKKEESSYMHLDISVRDSMEDFQPPP